MRIRHICYWTVWMFVALLLANCEPPPEPSRVERGVKSRAEKTAVKTSAAAAPPQSVVQKVIIEAPANAGEPDRARVETRYETTHRYPVLEEIRERNEELNRKRSDETSKIRQRQKKDKEAERENRKVLRSSLAADQIPASLEEFEIVPHLPPVPQYATGTCWSFAATSLVEAEVLRLTEKQIKLSEMYTVYFEYLGKGERYMAERSASVFAQGSETNAIFRILQSHGAVPLEAYKGVVDEDGRHNHGPLVGELKELLENAERNGSWDEKTMRAIFKVILEKHLGAPPSQFTYEGESYEPAGFVERVLKINPDDYVAFMSTLEIPFYTKGEFDVPDNWWRADDYHNLPLNEYFDGIKGALQNGYSVAIAVDVSEPGKDGANDVMFIPPYDIPGQAIDQLAREFRMVNESTTDDHAIHLVGYARRGDRDWFLAKDSGRSATLGRFEGYFFVRDDYIRLKALAFYVHKDAVKELLAKFG